MHFAHLPNCNDVEIDKKDRHWCLTYHREDVDLRIRIVHTCDDDPAEFFFEARPEGASKYLKIGETFFAASDGTREWTDPPFVEEFPTVWRTDFLQLARLWGELSEFAQFGPALGHLRRASGIEGA